MTPADLKATRHALGLSANQFARLLRVSDGGLVRRWERDSVPGAVSVLADMMVDLPEVKTYIESRPRPSWYDQEMSGSVGVLVDALLHLPVARAWLQERIEADEWAARAI